MRHGYSGRKLGRTANERSRLFANLLRGLFRHGRIITTLAKAKAVQAAAEKIITKAKKQSESGKRDMFSKLADRILVKSIMVDAVTRFAGRNGGYTRIVKISRRKGDGTEKAILSLVDEKNIFAAPHTGD